jgi:hypothetical protein
VVPDVFPVAEGALLVLVANGSAEGRDMKKVSERKRCGRRME